MEQFQSLDKKVIILFFIGLSTFSFSQRYFTDFDFKSVSPKNEISEKEYLKRESNRYKNEYCLYDAFKVYYDEFNEIDSVLYNEYILYNIHDRLFSLHSRYTMDNNEHVVVSLQDSIMASRFFRGEGGDALYEKIVSYAGLVLKQSEFYEKKELWKDSISYVYHSDIYRRLDSSINLDTLTIKNIGFLDGKKIFSHHMIYHLHTMPENHCDKKRRALEEIYREFYLNTYYKYDFLLSGLVGEVYQTGVYDCQTEDKPYVRGYHSYSVTYLGLPKFVKEKGYYFPKKKSGKSKFKQKK